MKRKHSYEKKEKKKRKESRKHEKVETSNDEERKKERKKEEEEQGLHKQARTAENTGSMPDAGHTKEKESS